MADLEFEEINRGTQPTKDGEGTDEAWTLTGKINRNFARLLAFLPKKFGTAASRDVGTNQGEVIVAGEQGGLFAYSKRIPNAEDVPAASILLDGPGAGSLGYPGVPNDPMLLIKGRDTSRSGGIQFSSSGLRFWGTTGERGHLEGDLRFARDNVNTTIDSNGFIKQASPIIKLFNGYIKKSDHLEIQSAELEKLGIGYYKIIGVPELSRSGWYIETPKDRNNNVYFTLDYEELGGELIIKTYEPDYSSGKPTNGEPVDILEGRFVSLRFEEDPSLYPDPEEEISED